MWSDEFTNNTGANAQPNPMVWTYDTGDSGFGNNELETYCAWGSNTAPCSTASPSAYVGTDGYLHIEAQQPSTGVYTSARLKTEGLFSFQYGRFEVRAQVPEAQGFWPAAGCWATTSPPSIGLLAERWTCSSASTPRKLPTGMKAPFMGRVSPETQVLAQSSTFLQAKQPPQWHTYGMIWTKGTVAYYIDDPAHPYVTYTTSSLSGVNGAVWPFDAGQSNFILLNLAIGGDWPGAPNSATPFPSEMLVDYVRVYTN